MSSTTTFHSSDRSFRVERCEDLEPERVAGQHYIIGVESMTRAKIALFVLEALPNARVVRRFVHDHAADLVLVGLSNAERRLAGGLTGQLRRHMARSGPWFLPYLATNFGLPDILRPAAPLLQAAGGARDTPEATPLRRLCADRGIPMIRVDDVNGEAVAEALRRAAPDLVVTFHFDQVLSRETIALARLVGINVHPALLPRHRGPVPTIHALADGDRAFGVTLHRLVPAIDAGAILVQAACDLPADVTATRAAILLHARARPLMDDLLDEVARDGALPEGRAVPTMPYRPFPPAAMLREMRGRGMRLTDRADLAASLTLAARA